MASRKGSRVGGEGGGGEAGVTREDNEFPAIEDVGEEYADIPAGDGL
jgi:hypothetical protein